jgi:hypothetical protein
MWAAITAMSSRIYMNMVKLARKNAHQQEDDSSDSSHPFPRKGPFPRVIGRPLPPTIPNNGRSKTPKRAEVLVPIEELAPPRSLSRRAFYANSNNAIHMGSLPGTATATLRTVDSEVFYSAYFQDQFTMDQLPYDEDSQRNRNVPIDVV